MNPISRNNRYFVNFASNDNPPNNVGVIPAGDTDEKENFNAGVKCSSLKSCSKNENESKTSDQQLPKEFESGLKSLAKIIVISDSIKGLDRLDLINNKADVDKKLNEFSILVDPEKSSPHSAPSYTPASIDKMEYDCLRVFYRSRDILDKTLDKTNDRTTSPLSGKKYREIVIEKLGEKPRERLDKLEVEIKKTFYDIRVIYQTFETAIHRQRDSFLRKSLAFDVDHGADEKIREERRKIFKKFKVDMAKLTEEALKREWERESYFS